MGTILAFVFIVGGGSVLIWVSCIVYSKLQNKMNDIGNKNK